MLTIAQVDLFQAQLQTKMLEVALEQAKAELNDDRDCAKVHQCTYRFLSIYFAVFTNPLYNYTMAQTEAMILWISAVTSLNEVIPVSFTDFTVINIGTDHTHTISQIIGLQETLDDLQAQIDNLEDTQITAIDGGHAPVGTGITITIRNDTTQNWTEQDPTLAIGEMGFAIDGDVVTGIKIGLGKIWSETPYHISPFTPIVTSTGRNLDAPWKPYNAQHNFQTEKEAWDYVLNPYSAASIAFINGGIVADVEVGTIYQGLGEVGPPYTTDYTFNIFNTSSIFVEGGKKVYYINNDFATHFDLTNQVSETVTQVKNAPIYANRTDAGLYKVFSAHIKDRLNPNVIYGAEAYVRFRLRSTAFLWKANSSLLNTGAYTDAQLSSIVKSMAGDVAGVKYTNMADGGGNKVFNGGNAITWDTRIIHNAVPQPPSASGGDGFFNIVVAAPASAGTPIVHNAASDASNPMLFSPVRNFTYNNGTANIPYVLYVVAEPIVGTLSVKIV